MGAWFRTFLMSYFKASWEQRGRKSHPAMGGLVGRGGVAPKRRSAKITAAAIHKRVAPERGEKKTLSKHSQSRTRLCKKTLKSVIA